MEKLTINTINDSAAIIENIEKNVLDLLYGQNYCAVTSCFDSAISITIHTFSLTLKRTRFCSRA